jgi:hypothetical protein
MWELPGIPVDRKECAVAAAKELAAGLVRFSTGSPRRERLRPGRPLDSLVHVFTHRRIRYHPILFHIAFGPLQLTNEESFRWREVGCGAHIPLPSAQKKLLTRLEATLAAGRA